MNISTQLSRRTKHYQCGLPVDYHMKRMLRLRKIPLNSEQRQMLKKAGIKVDEYATEVEVLKILKRVWKPEFKSMIIFDGENLKIITTDKPIIHVQSKHPKIKNGSARQHRMEVLEYRIREGSKRAMKQLHAL